MVGIYLLSQVFISPHSAASKLTTNTGTLSGKQHSYDEEAIPFWGSQQSS
jgi:hypothetical protein